MWCGGWRNNKLPGSYGFAILDGTKTEITAQTGFLAKHGLLLDDTVDRHYYEFCFSNEHSCYAALFRSKDHFMRAAACLQQDCPGALQSRSTAQPTPAPVLVHGPCMQSVP